MASDEYGDRRAARVIAVTTAKRVGRPAALWGLTFGAMIAATMAAYETSFPTAASRASMARTLEGNPAFEAIFGVIRRMDTVAGYTAYKTMFTLMLLGGIWGLLVSTRVLRGEEDTGRWELLLAGRTTRAGAAVQAAAGLGAGVLVMWVPTALLTVAGGASSRVDIAAGTCLFFAAAVVAAPAMFMAIGMFVSQLAPSRHDANRIGAFVLAGSYLVRMAADSDPGIGWLRWASPLGWIEELRPLTGSRAIAFVPIVALVVVLVAASIRIAAERDAGAGAIVGRDAPPPRTLLLGGQAGLTVRLTWPAVAGWLTALGMTGLVFGLVTQAAGTSLRGSPTLERVIDRLGASGAGAVVYLGFVFLIAAGLVAIAVAGQVSAIRNEEAAGHLDHLLVAPIARWRWLTVRLAVAVGLVVGASVLAGVAAWLGARTQHAVVGFGQLVEAGLNVAPPAVFILGVGALVYGVWPRATISATYGLVVWSFLVEIVASISDSVGRLRDTSPLLHIAPAPATDPNWVSASWLVGLGLLAAVIGIVAFGRRDLQGA